MIRPATLSGSLSSGIISVFQGGAWALDMKSAAAREIDGSSPISWFKSKPHTAICKRSMSAWPLKLTVIMPRSQRSSATGCSTGRT